MFFCAKKVMYLSLYEQGKKVMGAGFASLQGEGEKTCIKIQVRNLERQWDGVYPACIITEKGEMPAGKIKVEGGCGSCEKDVRVNLEKIEVVQVRLNEERIIANEWRQGRQETGQQTEQTQETERVQETAQVQEMKAASIFPDKWEQLKSQYQIIHPFGDEREFITIEPKDFVILEETSQRLVNNSFLLHGFYNYRHLILGKDHQLGTKESVCFYIGVPGVFFEREKMVAVMFGFEGFESAGPVEMGKFGYYLRKVEI